MFDKKAYMKEYQQKNREKTNERVRRWRERNPEKVKESNHQQYLKRKAKKEASGKE